MRRKILAVIAVIVLLTGIGFLLFPPISNFIGRQKAEQSAESFDRTSSSVTESITADDGEVIESAEQAVEYIEKKKKQKQSESGSVSDNSDDADYGFYINDDGWVIDSETDEPIVFRKDIDDLYKDSVAYNKMILTGQGTSDTIRFDKEALDITDYAVYDYSYGYITADSIGMRLPIFLGASDSMMSFGAAHLYGTSLPLGRESENCALAGHTDYIGRIFFDNIRNLDIGDTVSVTNYWGTIDYKVIDYDIVRPDDFSRLVIQSGRTLLTLITCIYDGDGGFDRYLVICEHKP